MSSTPPTSRPGRRSLFQVSGWPLRRKLALALTIPLLLAATLGGLRVHSDLTEASNSSATSDQVTVLRPAVDYLSIAERAMVAAQSGSTSNKAALADAVGGPPDRRREADGRGRASAGLTPEQSNQVDVVLDLSRSMREAGTETLSPGTWVAQLRQLQSATTRLVGTIANAQIVPEPRLELLAQTLSGRFSLAMQQALAATDRSGDTGSQELFSELGVEGAAIDRLAGGLGSSEPAVAALRTENAQRSREIRTGGTDLGGRGAYTRVRQPGHDADGRHRPAAVDVGHRREGPRLRQRRHHARSPCWPRCSWPSSSPASCSLPSARCARARWPWPTRSSPRRSPGSVRVRSPARSSRSTSPPKRRWASWPGPSTTCTSRRCCSRRARPACVRRSARCS